jgi:hypothetical protein
MILAGVVLWLFFGVVSAAIATARGRSGFGWFLLGILLGPFALAVALLPTAEAGRQEEARRRGVAPGWRKCPFCAEVVREEATVCRYCQRELRPNAASAGAADVDEVPAGLQLSEHEAAEAIGVSLGTLRGYLKSGRLTSQPGYRIEATELVKAGFIIRRLPPRP